MNRRNAWLLSACVFALLLTACGGTSQSGGGGTNPMGGGPAGGSGGAAGSAGMQGKGDTVCPTSQPPAEGACTDGQVCQYPGSPCGPPGFKYTCQAGKWKLTYEGTAVGVCLPEACPLTNPATGCPYTAPTQGLACGGECTITSMCSYPGLDALCANGAWQVTAQVTCPPTRPMAGTPCVGAVVCPYPNTESSCPTTVTLACTGFQWSNYGPPVQCDPPGGAGGEGGSAAGAAGEP